MFPNPYHFPSIVCQDLIVSFISFDIAFDLALPIFTIGLRKLTVTMRTTMPKAAIDEDKNTFFWENYVRLSSNVIHVLFPATQSHPR